MDLNSLNQSVEGRKTRKRVGRGNGSGWGGTSGRGHKGQKSRAGYSKRASFEGGQMPLFRKLPKRGFNNKIFKKIFVPINVEMLKRFPADSIVTIEDFKKTGIVKDYLDGIKILGTGEIDRKLTVTAHKFSKTAREKIEQAGGKCIELIPAVEKTKGKKAKQNIENKPTEEKLLKDKQPEAHTAKQEPQSQSPTEPPKEKPDVSKPNKGDKKK